MILDLSDKKSLSNIRMAKAYELLEDAKANHDERRYKTSTSRAYHTILNAAKSILILEGTNPETHDGIITLLSLKFIKPGILPVEVIKKFKILLSRRTDVDYGDFETVDMTESQDSLRLAEEVTKIIDKIRIEMIQTL